jgi:hypothetical protein
MPGQHGTLLARYQPCLRYDSLESYFADSAEEWTANPENRLRRKDGGSVPGPGGLSLDSLGPEYRDRAAASPADYVESTRDDYSRQYRDLREAHQDFRNVIYGRAVPRGNSLWLQYWFFYFLNDYQLAWGIDVHEGDWEMVQLRLDDGSEEPVEAVYAQHTFCEVRPWEAVRRLRQEKETEGAGPEPGDEDRPLVYVGRGSHASFYEPGFHETDFYDITDGKQRPKRATRLEDVTEPPGWLLWPGHWGGSRTGYGGPGAPCAHPQWEHPAGLIAKAREHDAKRAPGSPLLHVSRRRGRLAVDFDGSQSEQALKRLIVTVNSADEHHTPPRPFRFAVSEVEAGSLQTRIQLAADKHYDVRVAVVDLNDRPTAAQIFLFAPENLLLGLRRRISGFAGRLVHALRQAAGSEYARRTGS